jgi:hypothetical protein
MTVPNWLTRIADRATERNRPPSRIIPAACMAALMASALAAVIGYWPVAWLLAIAGWALFSAWALLRQAVAANHLARLRTRVTDWEATGRASLAEIQTDLELARAATKVETQDMRAEIRLLRQRLKAIREQYGQQDDDGPM